MLGVDRDAERRKQSVGAARHEVGDLSVFRSSDDLPLRHARQEEGAAQGIVSDALDEIPLWQLEQLPVTALEKRFTEFQVVGDDAGVVLATVGFQISGAHGLLHSEAVARPELADQCRELLWNRFQVIIHNHALERLWTRMHTPWWRTQGFALATEEEIAALPPAFHSEGVEWHTLTLRAADATAALEQEFARLKTVQQEETARLRERVLWIKRAALTVTVVVFILVVVWAVTLLKFGPKLFHR